MQPDVRPSPSAGTPLQNQWPAEIQFGRDAEYVKACAEMSKPRRERVHFTLRFLSRTLFSGFVPGRKSEMPNATPRDLGRVNLTLLLTRTNEVSLGADGVMRADLPEAGLPRLNATAQREIAADFAAMAPEGEFWFETSEAHYTVRFTRTPDGGFTLQRTEVKPPQQPAR